MVNLRYGWTYRGIFQFRKKRDGLISTAMEPVFGQAYKRPFRNVIDILAIIATVMGIATSIGLGIMQISGGLNHVFHVPNNNVTKLLLRYSWFVFS